MAREEAVNPAAPPSDEGGQACRGIEIDNSRHRVPWRGEENRRDLRKQYMNQ
jgi:hypothetical protein